MVGASLNAGTSKNQVGLRLRAIRKAATLSISDLGKKAGVSNGMISQIERGLTNPSLKTLERLHIALDVPLAALLESATSAVDGPDRGVVRRVEDRPLLAIGKTGITKELLTPAGDHNMEMLLVTVPPGGKTDEVRLGIGEKAGWILDGTIELTVSGFSSILNTGDSFQFSSAERHGIHNPGNEDARLVWVMCVQPTEVHL